MQLKVCVGTLLGVTDHTVHPNSQSVWLLQRMNHQPVRKRNKKQEVGDFLTYQSSFV